MECENAPEKKKEDSYDHSITNNKVGSMKTNTCKRKLERHLSDSSYTAFNLEVSQ